MQITNYNMDQTPPALVLDDSQNTSSFLADASSSLEGEDSICPLIPAHDNQASRRSKRSPFEDRSPLQRKKRKKMQGSNCVSFAVDSDNKIVVQYYIVMDEDRSPLTREDIADNWWRPIELRRIHQDASRAAADYREKHASTDSSRDLDRLFNVASQESSLIRSEESSSHSKMYIPDQCRQVCRGLERQVYASIQDYGHRYTKGILKVQSKLPADINPEMKARLLRARSLQLSKPSRMLAKFMAHGDAPKSESCCLSKNNSFVVFD